MKEIGMFEAKTHLSRIADEVRLSGHAVTLTKRGEPYVDLVPHQPGSPCRTKAELFLDLAQLQRELPKLSARQLRASVAEGRR